MTDAVLDTSALLRWTLAPELLGPTAADFLAGPDARLLISAVSIWEIATKVRRGQLHLGVSVDTFLARLENTAAVEFVSVDVPTWRSVAELPWEHGDPADRIIVVTARQRDAVLITSDRTMASFYPKAIW